MADGTSEDLGLAFGASAFGAADTEDWEGDDALDDAPDGVGTAKDGAGDIGATSRCPLDSPVPFILRAPCSAFGSTRGRAGGTINAARAFAGSAFGTTRGAAFLRKESPNKRI